MAVVVTMPPSPQMPNTAEPVPVQLTRIEGVINLIAYQQGEMRDDVRDLGQRVDGLTVRVQAVETQQAHAGGASASWRTWLPILAALASAVAAFVAIMRM